MKFKIIALQFLFLLFSSSLLWGWNIVYVKGKAVVSVSKFSNQLVDVNAVCGKINPPSFRITTESDALIILEHERTLIQVQPNAVLEVSGSGANIQAKLVQGSLFITTPETVPSVFIVLYGRVNRLPSAFSGLFTLASVGEVFHLDVLRGNMLYTLSSDSSFKIKQKQSIRAERKNSQWLLDYQTRYSGWVVPYLFELNTGLLLKNIYSENEKTKVHVDRWLAQIELKRTEIEQEAQKVRDRELQLQREKERELLAKRTSKQTVNKTSKKQVVNTPSKQTKLEIISEPIGAAVVFSGSNIGKTPVTIDIVPGKYEVSATLINYKPYYTRVNTRFLTNSKLYLQMSAKPCGINLQVEPASAISFVRNKTGETLFVSTNSAKKFVNGKVELPLSIGEYEIFVTKPGYLDFKKVVTLSDGAFVTVPVKMVERYNFSKAKPFSSTFQNTNLLFPSGLSAYENRLYIADSGNKRVVISDNDGKLLNLIASGGEERLIRPAHLSVTKELVAISDEHQNKLFFYGHEPTALPEEQYVFQRSTRIKEELRIPLGISGRGRFNYLADSGNNLIRIYESGFEIKKIGVDLSLDAPNAVYEHEGKIYISDWGNTKFLAIDDNGWVVESYEFDFYPAHGTFLPNGKFYLCDPDNDQVRIYEKGFKKFSSINFDKGSRPYGIAFATDRLYVSLRDLHKIVVLYEEGYK